MGTWFVEVGEGGGLVCRGGGLFCRGGEEHVLCVDPSKYHLRGLLFFLVFFSWVLSFGACFFGVGLRVLGFGVLNFGF